MTVILNHFWFVLIVVTIANGAIWKLKSKKYIAEKPEREQGYDKLIMGWLIYGNIPWIIMGIGMLTGLTKSMDEFLRPSQMNLVVIVFFFSIVLLWIYGSYWIYFKGGAESLVEHPGFITQTEKGNEKFETMKVKLVWGLGLLGGILGLYMIYK